MGCFRIDLTSPLELLFYGLSLLQAYRALQLAGMIRRDWTGFRQPPLTHHKMYLVEEAAFLLAIPPSVIVHEYFHAIPIWGFGGQVVSCGYGFYWGFVQADRLFPPAQDWLISLGGTIGSLLFAAVLFLLLFKNQSQSLRYFARRSLRTLLNYTLIYYPVFSAVTFIGDWRVIYNFSATPLLSGATAVAHAALLFLFWQANRRGWFEMVGHKNQGEVVAFAQLEADWRSNPHNATVALNYVEALRQGGAPQQAKKVLAQLIAQQPTLAGAYLQLALIQTNGKRKVPKTAVNNLEKALQLGLEAPNQRLIAHQFLSQYYQDIDQGQLALQHLDEAIAALSAIPELKRNVLHTAQLYHLRSLAHQRQQQHGQARQDADQALALAQTAGDEKAITFYQREIEMLHGPNGRR